MAEDTRSQPNTLLLSLSKSVWLARQANYMETQMGSENDKNEQKRKLRENKDYSRPSQPRRYTTVRREAEMPEDPGKKKDEGKEKNK